MNKLSSPTEDENVYKQQVKDIYSKLENEDSDLLD